MKIFLQKIFFPGNCKLWETGLILIFILISAGESLAGTTGKLSGTIKDAQTSEPIPGVNVIVEGSGFGAATDVNGFYTINNLPPGNYKVTLSAIGYQKKQFVNVKISTDFTTKIDAELSTKSIELETIVVEAESPLIRKDLTSSQTSVDAAQIESLPVESVTQLLVLQAGIIQGTGGEIHIRGGRSSEIAYTVNGVSISNPYDNSRSVNIATNAIEELSVVSGTFNAEYGNALSGIVNTITKEGGKAYTGKVSFYTGDYVSDRTFNVEDLNTNDFNSKNPFFNIDDVDPFNTYTAELTLSGPFPLLEENLSFFISQRYDSDEGYLYGVRQHLPSDSVYKNPLDPNDIQVFSSGDDAIVSMNGSKEYNATAKLTYKPAPTMKINYDLIYSNSQYQGYNHDYKYNPDANYNNYEWGLLNSLELRHTLNSKTFYTLRGSYNINDYKRYLYQLLDSDNNAVDFHPGMDISSLHADPRYNRTDRSYTVANYTFVSGGTQNGHFYQRTNTLNGKFDITSQISNSHEIKSGIEVASHELEYVNFTVLHDNTFYLDPTIDLSTDSPTFDEYTKTPFVFSAYIQDKMEFEKLILNVGIRYDGFDVDSKYSTDIYNPSPNNPNISPLVDTSKLLADAPYKYQISPRVGISFPITDKGIIHFSYGHFFQMPPFAYLYTNPNFEYSFASGSPVFGNANLNPEKTVSYELGLQQQLFEDLAFNITGFYKDVRDLLALQQIRISADETYFKYVNKDYSNVKGITFSLTKRKTPQSIFGVTLDYTYQVAEGNEVDADAFFLDLSSGRQSEKIPVFLGWDQSHTLTGTISVGESNNWNVSMVGRFGTGLPYTPVITGKQIYLRTNSDRRPTQSNVDLLAEKSFSLSGIKLNVFLKVYNLFDVLNERLIYTDTGRATYTLLTSQGSAQATDKIAETVTGVHSAQEYFIQPQFYLPPREVKLGFSIEF
jgi:outer membrane receptor protein involved in Fe transport